MKWYRVKFDELLVVVCTDKETGEFIALAGGNMGKAYSEGEAVWRLIEEFYAETHEYREKFDPKFNERIE